MRDGKVKPTDETNDLDVKYLIPFYDKWDGDRNTCYIVESEEELQKKLNEEYTSEIGRTFQVYKVVPVYKIKLDLGITHVVDF